MKKKHAKALWRVVAETWPSIKEGYISVLQSRVSGPFTIVSPRKNYYRSLKRTFLEGQKNDRKANAISDKRGPART